MAVSFVLIDGVTMSEAVFLNATWICLCQEGLDWWRLKQKNFTWRETLLQSHVVLLYIMWMFGGATIGLQASHWGPEFWKHQWCFNSCNTTLIHAWNDSIWQSSTFPRRLHYENKLCMCSSSVLQLISFTTLQTAVCTDSSCLSTKHPPSVGATCRICRLGRSYCFF